ncbi:MAG: gliding motility-associated C-terminal domain-containing protein [Bacteroidetes bacterium]|nr:gliding motility-associated C-terminal domain-containing protein [Bacteroidota bacterium]
MKIKAFLVILFILIMAIFCRAQNLVPNPSFEDTISCPNAGGQLNQTLYWFNPTSGSPDYYNLCSNGMGVPLNGAGFQYALSGKAYVGVYVAARMILNGPLEGREYIQAALTDTLIQGKEYCISFSVSLGDYSTIAITQIGAHLSITPISLATPLNFTVLPQIVSPANYFINDTANWHTIQGTYTALGGEKYITIGNFKDVTNTDTMNLPPTVSPSLFSYYFIDDVSLQLCDTTSPFDETIIANVFTPNNDGINEQWVLNNLPEKTQVQIYNRWGVLVAGIAPPFTIQGTYKWDGRTTSGVPCVEGTYFYLISTPEKTYKGFVQLVR